MQKQILPLAFLVSIIIVWQAGAVFFQIPGYLLPKPTEILSEFYNTPGLVGDFWITFVEAFFGLLLGSFAAILLAVLFVYSTTAHDALFPIAVALKSVPIVALAPLMLLWVGTGLESKIIMSALMSFFPVLVNTTIGLQSIGKSHLEYLLHLGASELQILAHLRFPVALPYFFSALKISATLAVVGAIVAEMVGAKSGLGFFLIISTYHFETAKVFAALILSAFLGNLFVFAVSAIESLTYPRR